MKHLNSTHPLNMVSLQATWIISKCHLANFAIGKLINEKIYNRYGCAKCDFTKKK